MQLEYWRLGPTVSSVSELFCVPNPLHNAYMGLTQSHLCWWLLAALPVRLLEWGCLIPKQCLLLPVSPLPICVDLLTHVGTRGTVLALFLYMALASRGVRIDLRAGRESRVARDVCSLLTTVRPGSVYELPSPEATNPSYCASDSQVALLGRCEYMHLYLLSLFCTKIWSVLRFTKNWLWVLMFNEHIFT